MADFLLIFLIHLFALLLPGPDFFIVSAYALKADFKKAFLVVCGISLAVLIWIILSLGGLKLVLESFPLMKTLLTLLGIFLFVISSLLAPKKFGKKKKILGV
ncbi:LysE family transporter [Helicobacter mehlei]|uniref:LysE family transporter n=1 Tax=Helicobacter mehlei TaxID=2316080 RepID=UPI00228717A1|nr:LysE family transporter [Helicobacter mehlei]